MSDSTLHKATGKDLSRDLFLDDVVAGLTAQRKSLDPKYFYDETGSGAGRGSSCGNTIVSQADWCLAA